MDLNYSPNEIKQLIQMLKKMLPDAEETSDKQIEDNSNTHIRNDPIVTKSRKSVKNDQQNKFLEMPEKNMYKSDSQIDKKLSIHPPTPRNRKFVLIDVRCRICGKQDRVNPALLPDSVERYKCNSCSASPGA